MTAAMPCPCCGRPMPAGDVSLDALRSLRLGRVQGAVLAALIAAYPRRVSKELLFDLVYGHDANGGPDVGSRVIPVYICHIRRHIRPLGWMVPPETPGRVAAYRLQPIGGAA